MMLFLSHLSFVAFAAEVFFAAYVIMKDPRPLLNWLFAMLSVEFSLWSLGYAYLYMSTTPEQAFFWYRVSSLGWVTIMVTGLHFVIIFTNTVKKTIRPFILFPTYIASIALLLKAWNGILYTKEFIWSDGLLLELGATESPWFWGYLAYNTTTLLVVIIILIHFINKTGKSNEKRRQVQGKIILRAYIFTSIFTYLFNIIGIIFNLTLPVIGHLAFLFGIGGIWYAMMRYQFLTISSVIASSSIISSMADLLFLLDQNGRIIQTNERASDFFPISQSMPFTSLINSPSDLKYFENLVPGDSTFIAHELKLRVNEEEAIPVRATISVISDQFDEELGYSVVAHDISDTIALEEKNRLIDNQLALAQRIQQNLMPSRNVPVPGPFRVSSLYLPMEKLGGDFYDILQMRDSDTLGIFVSDVSGHGVPAALITSMVKALMTTAGVVRNSPDELMAYLNQTLTGNLETNFLTASYSLLNSSDKTITMARAGHPPAYIIKPDSIESLYPSGTLLGVKSQATWEKAVYSFHPGDIFLCYTDGLTEATDCDGTLFEKQMEEILTRRLYDSSDELIHILADELSRFTCSHIREDDILIIAVEYR